MQRWRAQVDSGQLLVNQNATFNVVAVFQAIGAADEEWKRQKIDANNIVVRNLKRRNHMGWQDVTDIDFGEKESNHVTVHQTQD
jgi:hypothetical protein